MALAKLELKETPTWLVFFIRKESEVVEITVEQAHTPDGAAFGVFDRLKGVRILKCILAEPFFE